LYAKLNANALPLAASGDELDPVFKVKKKKLDPLFLEHFWEPFFAQNDGQQDGGIQEDDDPEQPHLPEQNDGQQDGGIQEDDDPEQPHLLEENEGLQDGGIQEDDDPEQPHLLGENDGLQVGGIQEDDDLEQIAVVAARETATRAAERVLEGED
jgi:hypothetical protein